MLVDQLLRQRALSVPERPALITDRAVISHSQLDARCAALASHLVAAGLSPGDRLLVLLPNCGEYVEVVFAAARAGLVTVPFNPRAGRGELEAVCRGSRPAAIATTPERAGELAGLLEAGAVTVLPGTDGYEAMIGSRQSPPLPPAGRSDSDPWLVSYTSGSTGRPKGAVLSHRAKATSALVEVIEFGTGPDDVALINTPLFHVHALVHVLTVLLAGGAVRVEPGFDPERTLRLVETGEVTELSMVPTMYRSLLAAATSPQPSRPRLARCTGAAMPAGLQEELSAGLPNWPLHLFYGATEAGAISLLRPWQRSLKPASIGLPFLGVEVEVRAADGAPALPGEEGEVYIRSAAAFSGYFGAELDRYREWLTLGDLGSLDEDGYLTLTGRIGDRIVTGGEKVAPGPVEEVLSRQAGVLTAAVFGVPDPVWGEAVWAAVQGRPEAGIPGLAAACERELAPHQRPKRFLLLDSLPLTATGKIDRLALRSLAQAQPGQGVQPK